MRRLFRVCSLVPLIFGLLLAGEGIRLFFHRVELGIPEEKVGPDVYLIVIGALIICCGLAECFTTGLHAQEKAPSDQKQREILAILGLFVAYVILLPFLGFTFSTAFFFFSFALFIPKYRWTKAVIMTAIVTMSYYIIFWEVAQVVLPRGIVGF